MQLGCQAEPPLLSWDGNSGTRRHPGATPVLYPLFLSGSSMMSSFTFQSSYFPSCGKTTKRKIRELRRLKLSSLAELDSTPEVASTRLL